MCHDIIHFFRLLQEKLEQPISEPPSPRDIPTDGDMAGSITENIQLLKGEVSQLKNQLTATQTDRKPYHIGMHVSEYVCLGVNFYRCGVYDLKQQFPDFTCVIIAHGLTFL